MLKSCFGNDSYLGGLGPELTTDDHVQCPGNSVEHKPTTLQFKGNRFAVVYEHAN
jgi:hypothetical protein